MPPAHPNPNTDPAAARRIELILGQVDSLPTLPAVAVKILSLTSSDQSSARQVIDLIAADQALTAKVLSICRRADIGIRDQGLTIDKAVVLLGFSTIRNAVLSIKVYDLFDRSPVHPHELDRKGLWRHSLAVAIAAEKLAQAYGAPQPDLDPGDAYVCGLLHDVGKVALDFVLPKSYARVVELVELNQSDIAEFERRILAIDHHTAGKRLAEQWQLPHRVQDCVWLHGTPFELLPKLPHRRMIGLIGLADLLVRQSHIGYSGNFRFQSTAPLAQAIGLDQAKVEAVAVGLHEQFDRQCAAFGLDETPSRELFIQSIQHANQMLGTVNASLERRARAATRMADILDAVTGFHGSVPPGRGVEDVLAAVVKSAAVALGAGFYAILHQRRAGDPWLVAQFSQDNQPAHTTFVDPPTHAPDLISVDATQPASMNLMGILPWLTEHLLDSPVDIRDLRVLPLGCGWGTSGLLIHNRPTLPPWRELLSLTHTWGAAIASAGQHDGARRLGEELAEANRDLAQAQDKLLRSESMARVGEMAAGAAHEMNNPLAVICGRAQLLASSLPHGSKEQQAADTIAEQAQRLSDLITSLRIFADPPKARRQPTDLARLLERTIKRLQADYAERNQLRPIDCQVYGQPQIVNIDPDLTASAVTELLLNSLQSNPRTGIQVNARIHAQSNLITIEVIDDGAGMDEHTLAHALDPFFSAKSAGRRVGMGLTRAQQMAVAHDGEIALRSIPAKGTTAILSIKLPDQPAEAAA